MTSSAPDILPPEDDALRADGALVNLFTGLGVPGKDKKLANQVVATSLLTQHELEQLYKNGLVRRYVDAIPQTVLRHRPTIKIASEEDTSDTVAQFDNFLRRSSFYQKLREVIQLQRLYGGACLVLLIDDGQPPEAPVDLKRLRAINGFVPLSRHEIIPEDISFTDYSKPETYRITTHQKLTEDQQTTYVNLRIHHTRVARFDGLYLPWNLRVQNTGWGQSVIEVIWDAWQDYISALGGLNTLIAEGDLLVHNIPGLMQRIASGGEDAIKKRMELNRLSRSMYGTYVLDKEETLTNLSRNLNNISTAIEPFVQHLQAVTGWPASILMGTSPGGLGKEGRFEERVWASLVEEWQTGYCQDPVADVFTYILASREGPTRGRPPEDWEVHFPSVFTQTDEEKATLRNLISQSDNTYVQLGVLNAVEIRQARFGSAEFSLETPLNDAITEQLLATTQAQFEAQMLQMEAQKQAALNPPQPGEPGAPPEGDTTGEASGAIVPPDAAAKQDIFDHYDLHGLRIRVTHTRGDIKAGHLVGPDGQRTDSSAAAPLMVFGPHRTKAYSLYRAQFVHNDELIDGPYVTGFASLRAARQGVSSLYPRQTVAGLTRLPEDVTASLRAGWDTY